MLNQITAWVVGSFLGMQWEFTQRILTKTSVAPMVEEVMEEEMMGPQTVDVSMPSGTSSPGCEETDSCFIPSMVSINSGDTVNWINDDTAAHTVTSGSPSDGPDQIFDSSLVMAGTSFEFTFDNSGSYDYFCMVHPWMVGNVQVS
jgi:plastocyanin